MMIKISFRSLQEESQIQLLGDKEDHSAYTSDGERWWLSAVSSFADLFGTSTSNTIISTKKEQ